MSKPKETSRDRIRTALQRNRKALEQRAYLGRGTATTRARIREGYTCEIEDGSWRLTADLGEKAGGNGQGPDPGVFGRAALASCLAVGYVTWATDRDVPIDALEVEVQADYDARGEYGVGDVSPAYSEIRYIVHVTSPAPEAEIVEMLDTADAHSPYLALFRDPQRTERAVDYSRSEEV